jgi:hypothetical protein
MQLAINNVLGGYALTQIFSRPTGGFAAPGVDWREQYGMELQAWGNLKSQFPGSAGTWIRWLIDKKIANVAQRFAIEHPSIAGGHLTTLEARASREAPLPEWMKPYLETFTEPAQETEGRGRRRQQQPTTRAELRPLGAQEVLDPEQMATMAGFQAWQEAGAPTRYSSGAIREMADWEKWWIPYTRLSESLFPGQANLPQRWRVASQR